MKWLPSRAFPPRCPAALAAVCLFLLPARGAAQAAPDLDAGFHAMYETKFTQARASFLAYERAHPADPLGPAAEALH